VDYLGTRPFVDPARIGGIGMCGSGGFLLSAAQVDWRLKAVATVSMVDISRMAAKGPLDSLTDEARGGILEQLAEQRYTDFEAAQPALSPRSTARRRARLFSEDAYKRAAEPKELYAVPNAGHVDLYDKTDLIPFDKLTEFFTENLASEPHLAIAGA
jgi:fermentation-respiration switch protein FrsA (DUF1100 family)